MALAIMAFLMWVEFHWGRTALIDSTVERFTSTVRPADSGISRAIANTKSVLARHLASGAAVQLIQERHNLPRSDLLYRRMAIDFACLQAGEYQVELHDATEDS